MQRNSVLLIAFKDDSLIFHLHNAPWQAPYLPSVGDNINMADAGNKTHYTAKVVKIEHNMYLNGEYHNTVTHIIVVTSK